MGPTRTLNLRVKAKNGQHTLNHFTADSTVGDLKAKLSEVTGIDADSIRILNGFPPKPMDLTDNIKSLGTAKLCSGDTLIIEEGAVAKVASEKRQTESLLHEVQNQYTCGEGILTREVVPANNSCLFTSIHFVMENGSIDLNSAKPMRELISTIVASDPDTYNDTFLDKPNKSYCVWILKEDHWGGAIEISILSKYYSIEIDVVDTQSGRIDRFGEDQAYPQRVLILYDGIHYDPLKLESVDPLVKPITKFSTADDRILSQALELAAEAKASRQFTDVAKFTLRCLVCQRALKGQTEAQAHASKTGHINFGEV